MLVNLIVARSSKGLRTWLRKKTNFEKEKQEK